MENHYNPTEIIFGEKSLERLPEVAKRFKFKKVFLVTGRNSSDSSGLTNKVADYIGELQQYKVNPNPTTFDIEQGISIIEKGMPYLFIGLGGGSAIDTAKAISVLSKNKGLVANYQDKKLQIKNRGHPLIAIPTTAGTGSEVTPYSSLMKADKTKASIAHNFLYPNVAIIDPELTYNSPKEVIACSGMDALCQAIESFWSVNATEESKEYSGEAIHLALDNLTSAVNNPNLENRTAMLKSSHLAGKAISIAKTTAAHSLSYPFTSYHDISHGHAVMLTLPYFFEINEHTNNRNIQKKEGFTVEYARKTFDELLKILNVRNGTEAKGKLINLMNEIGLERSLRKLNVSQNDLQNIVDNGFNPQRVVNNPVVVTQEHVWKILKIIL